MTGKVAPHEVDRVIAELATRQHGVVEVGQLLARGIGADQVETRAARGRLHRVHRGVYVVGHRALTQDERWLAAVLACGPGAALSHGHAALLWSIRPALPAGPIDVTLPTRAGRKRRQGIRVHRPRILREQELTSHREIPVTTPARTALDLAQFLRGRPLERAVDEAHRRGLCTAEDLIEMLDVHPGHPGHRWLHAVLARHDIGSTLTRSELEERFLRLCRDEGLPTPLVNTPLLEYVVDFYWPAANLVVELDGFASHGTRDAFERDRDRDSTLAAHGFTTLRFTWRDLTIRRTVVADRIRRVLQERGAFSGR